MLKLVEKLTNDIKDKMPQIESEINSLLVDVPDDIRKDLTSVLSEAKKGNLTHDEVVNRFKKWM